MEIYKRLGRLQARQGKTAEALKAWATLASLFPQDRFALQELGELLTEEEQLDEAIKYYNRLADLSKDDGYRRLITRVEVGQIQVRQGKLKTAIATFDECLAQVEPESWVARDIRRRIEEIFLRSDDLNGLSEYYRDRLKRQPDDLNAMVRLAATTDRLGDRKAALEQYRAAVKLAPARKDLREAMIAELVRADKLAEALAEAVALAEKNPADIDAWKRVGELSLKAASPADRSKAEAEALEAWRRIAALRPADPALAVQAAELCRQAAGI
jgi:tetratricopeptide (TPR) repeat protein